MYLIESYPELSYSALGMTVGLLLGYTMFRLPRDLRRLGLHKALKKARVARKEINRILQFKRVPARTVLQIAREQEPVGGRHRYVEAEPEQKLSLIDRIREKMDQASERWKDTWFGPIRSPELVAQMAYDRERGGSR